VRAVRIETAKMLAGVDQRSMTPKQDGIAFKPWPIGDNVEIDPFYVDTTIARWEKR
jgi:hypothetical protein